MQSLQHMQMFCLRVYAIQPIQRCLEELRLQRTKNTHQRSKNVEEKENTVVHDVMMKEWEKMQAENSTLQSVSLSPKCKPACSVWLEPGG